MAHAHVFRRRVAEDVLEIARARRRRTAPWLPPRAVSGVLAQSGNGCAANAQVALRASASCTEAADVLTGTIGQAIHASAALGQANEVCAGILHTTGSTSPVIDPNYSITARPRLRTVTPQARRS